MKKFLTLLFPLLLVLSARAADADLEFKIDISKHVSLLKIIPGDHFVDVSINRMVDEKLGALTLGMVILQIGDTETWVPMCLAKLIKSTQPNHMEVSLYTAPQAFHLQESMLDIDFSPPSNAVGEHAVKYRFQLLPLMLKSAFLFQPGTIPGKQHQIKFSDECHEIELDLLVPRKVRARRAK